jgi:glycerol-3-phosphate cytidylyltransferase-like family protein
MLADYGKMVKKLDADLVKEREDQTSTLEQKLRDRKQKRLREIEVARKEKEVLLNAETVKTTSKLNTEMKQIESLLDPIKDEEDRMAMILA